MSLATNYEEFKREVEFIIKQNPLECELYSIVAAIVREASSDKEISLRDVTNLKGKSKVINTLDRKYNTENNIYGVTDFLVIDPKYTFSNRETDLIRGCIEVKALYKELDIAINDNLTQFAGCIAKY